MVVRSVEVSPVAEVSVEAQAAQEIVSYVSGLPPLLQLQGKSNPTKAFATFYDGLLEATRAAFPASETDNHRILDTIPRTAKDFLANFARADQHCQEISHEILTFLHDLYENQKGKVGPYKLRPYQLAQLFWLGTRVACGKHIFRIDGPNGSGKLLVNGIITGLGVRRQLRKDAEWIRENHRKTDRWELPPGSARRVLFCTDRSYHLGQQMRGVNSLMEQVAHVGDHVLNAGQRSIISEYVTQELKKIPGNKLTIHKWTPFTTKHKRGFDTPEEAEAEMIAHLSKHLSAAQITKLRDHGLIRDLSQLLSLRAALWKRGDRTLALQEVPRPRPKKAASKRLGGDGAILLPDFMLGSEADLIHAPRGINPALRSGSLIHEVDPDGQASQQQSVRLMMMKTGDYRGKRGNQLAYLTSAVDLVVADETDNVPGHEWDNQIDRAGNTVQPVVVAAANKECMASKRFCTFQELSPAIPKARAIKEGYVAPEGLIVRPRADREIPCADHDQVLDVFLKWYEQGEPFMRKIGQKQPWEIGHLVICHPSVEEYVTEKIDEINLRKKRLTQTRSYSANLGPEYYPTLLRWLHSGSESGRTLVGPASRLFTTFSWAGIGYITFLTAGGIRGTERGRYPGVIGRGGHGLGFKSDPNFRVVVTHIQSPKEAGDVKLNPLHVYREHHGLVLPEGPELMGWTNGHAVLPQSLRRKDEKVSVKSDSRTQIAVSYKAFHRLRFMEGGTRLFTGKSRKQRPDGGANTEPVEIAPLELLNWDKIRGFVDTMDRLVAEGRLPPEHYGPVILQGLELVAPAIIKPDWESDYAPYYLRRIREMSDRPSQIYWTLCKNLETRVSNLGL